MLLPPGANRPLLSTACRPPLRRLQASRRYVSAHGGLAVRVAAGSGGSSGGSSGSSGGSRSPAGSSSVQNCSGLSEAQLQAEAERLMRFSRANIQRLDLSRNTDESMQQRMALLLRLGFSQAAIEAAVERERRRGAPGGPYIAEQHIREAVALLQRWGFSQEQLNSVLADSRVLTRTAADIEAVLVWLQRQFGLQRVEVALTCSRQPAMLAQKQETLQANWRAFEAAYQPAASARTALAAALRAGRGHFLRFKPKTIRRDLAYCCWWYPIPACCDQGSSCFNHPGMLSCRREKVHQLQQLFFVDDRSLPKHIGEMAALLALDIPGTIQPRLAFLQALTGAGAASQTHTWGLF